MKPGDLICGILFMVTGTIFYLYNYRREGDSARRAARLGLGLIFAGGLLVFGPWMLALALGGQ